MFPIDRAERWMKHLRHVYYHIGSGKGISNCQTFSPKTLMKPNFSTARLLEALGGCRVMYVRTEENPNEIVKLWTKPDQTRQTTNNRKQ
jgi:hypothetical protein